MNRRRFIYNAAKGLILPFAAPAFAGPMLISGPQIIQASACSTVMDSNDAAQNSETTIGSSNTIITLAAKFVAAQSYTICSFAADLKKNGAPDQTITGSVWSVDADMPSTMLGEGDALNASELSDTEGWFRMTGLNVPVIAGSTYYVAIRISASASGNNVNWFRNSSGPGGSALGVAWIAQRNLSGTWASSATTKRSLFRIYSS